MKNIRNILRSWVWRLDHTYAASSYLIRQKVRVLFWLQLVGFFLFFIVMVISLTVSPPYYTSAILDLISLTTIAFSLWFLWKGRYETAVFLLLFVFSSAWIVGFYLKMDHYLVTGVNSFFPFMFAILTFVAFFGSRIQVAFFFALLTFFTLLYFILSFLQNDTDLFIRNQLGMGINSVMSLIIVFLILWLSATITQKVISLLTRELSRNKELNLSLERKVEERTQRMQEAMFELEQMNTSLVETNLKLDMAREVMDQDMRLAHFVQQKYFERSLPENCTWELAVYHTPMTQVSGDFYDFYFLENKLQGVSLFDVSGHGVASALITMLARSIGFRHFRDRQGEDLGEIMKSMNREIIQEIGGLDQYLSGLMLSFVGSDKVVYGNAGHPELILKRYQSQTVETDFFAESNKGTFMGISMLEGDYPVVELTVAKGDLLLLYSDGIIESGNQKGDFYGMEKLLHSLAEASPDASAVTVRDGLIEALNHFCGDRDPDDDRTLIVLRKLSGV